MRYRCMHCDRVFELADSERPRCPTCMRVHGVSAVQAAGAGAAAGGAKRRPIAIALGAVLAVAIAAGVLLWHKRAGVDSSLGGASAALSAELARLGVADEGLAHLLEPTEEVAQWADAIASKASSGLPQAIALVVEVRKQAKVEAFVPWSLVDARNEPGPLGTGETLALLKKDRARKQLYPFEVTALVVAALRSLDQPAVMVEVYAFPDEPRPLDPSGRFGYYAVGLRDDAGALQHVLDPYQGRDSAGEGAAPKTKQTPRQSDLRVLSDREVVGAALAIRAAHALAKDPGKALKDADAAVALAPSSPTTRSARAIALLGNAGSEEAIRELQAASQLRTDGPRRHNLAVVYLAMGDIEAADRELKAALEASPELASAHVTKAGFLLAQRDADGARKSLSDAERIDPQLSSLPLVWAQYYQSLGETAQALVQAERGVERQPEDPQPRILLAQLYRAAGQAEPMREQAKRVLTLVPPEQRDRVRTLLLQMLGADALGPVAAPAKDTAMDLGGSLGDGPQLQLGSSRKGPSLLGESSPTGSGEPPASGTLRGSESAPRLQLHEP